MADEPKPKVRKSRKSQAVTSAPSLDTKAVLAATAGARLDMRLQAGDPVFAQGDAADAVYFVQAGRIQLTVVSDQGKEGVIALFGPGDFFGEGCLAGQPIRLASAMAMTPSSVFRIERATMTRLLQEKRDFSEKFMAFLLTRNIQVEADLVDQLFNSSEKRLARLLLLLANFNNDGELRPITPKISQDVLAARVGTTRSRINYFMNKFRRLKLIEYNGEIKVHTALLNVIVHD
ncbi:MAG TPA: Crp/Fnr family transcriptional regulator [Bauldia sp.]|nr:Crp/Fnr family transcriptional regulator [Bauldia sp.]